MKRFHNQRVIVSGAGGGIGRAICLRLASEGATVGVFEKNPDAAEAIRHQIVEAGGTASVHVVDLVDHTQVEAAVSAFEEAGPTDVLINNVGWDRVMNFLDSSPELWNQLIDINLRAHLNLLHATLKGMADRGAGAVVTIASDAGRVGSSGEAVYSACKGGLIALTKSLARELARKKVRLNAVCPGPTDTPLLRSFLDEGEHGQKIYESLKKSIPFRRLAEPQDIVGAVAFLASADAEYITGQTISVSGGLTMHG